MNSEEESQKLLAATRALPDEILDAEAKKAGVPEDQWPLHRAMIRGEPNAFLDELETVDGLLKSGDIVLMTNPASKKLVMGQQKLFYKQTRSSHVALIHADFVCVDSMPGAGVTNRTVSKLLHPAGDDWRVIRCDQVTDTDAMMQACAYYLAQPYRVLPSKFSAKSYAYCSELARKVYVRCGVIDVGIPNDYVIAPAHFDMLADDVAGSTHWQDVTESVRPAVNFCKKYEGLVDISVRLFIDGLQLNRKRYMQRTEALKKIEQLERSGKISKEKATEARKSIQATEGKMNHTFWDVRPRKAQASSFRNAETSPEPTPDKESTVA
ncbi:hypothetical protein DDE05_27250 [Streptomyces cavourensis]|nr:hypothetical protein DDE05_27250 [Streptomyces cavourensis]